MTIITKPARPPIPRRPREPLGNRPLPKGIVAVDQSPLVPGQASPGQTARDRAPEGTLVVGREIHLKGQIEDCRVLVVEGRVEAAVKAERLEVRAGGSFIGSAEVAQAEIAGRFDGTLRASERLSIAATGRVEGDIRYRRIAIEAGGEIAGEVEVGAEAEVAETEPSVPGLTGTGD